MSDNENEQANEKNEVDGQRPLVLADGQGPSASSALVVDDQTTDGRGGEGEGNVMTGMSAEERAVDGTSYLAAVMIGGRRRAAHRGGGSEAPRDQQAMRARKVEGRGSQKRGKEELRGDQATNSGGNVRVLGCVHTRQEVIVDPEDENESSPTRFLKFRKGKGWCGGGRMWHGDGCTMRKENGILKTLLPYTGTRLRCQDAWPSCCCRKATTYTSFAFGSTNTWRQLTGSIYGFQGYGNNLMRLDCSYANKFDIIYIYIIVPGLSTSSISI